MGTVVPQGFITDGFTVPWFLWWLLSPTGKGMEASVVHDWELTLLKSTESRKHADIQFRKVLSLCEVGTWRLNTAYIIVRVFGALKVRWIRLCIR